VHSSGKRPLTGGLPRLHLQPGIVRWLMLGIAGAALTGGALIYGWGLLWRQHHMPPLVALLTLQFLPPWARGLVGVSIGAAPCPRGERAQGGRGAHGTAAPRRGGGRGAWSVNTVARPQEPARPVDGHRDRR